MIKDNEEQRKDSKFAYDVTEHNFIGLLNENLLNIESQLLIDTEEIFPTIFLLGLPRSGTTLLSQLIFNNLEVGCTNNLIAKFWKTPLTGCYLSKITLGSRKSDSYESTYGKTKDVYSPHEFSWFWHNLLNIKNVKEYDPEVASKEIDWSNVRSVLLNINRLLECVVLHKPLELLGYHLKKINELLKKALFIYIERDMEDIAFSLAKARLEYYNDLNVWWGSYPFEYSKIKDKPFQHQIAGQIYYLSKMYEENLRDIDEQRLIRISYKELCLNPQGVLEQIKSKLQKDLGYTVNQINTPSPFKLSEPKLGKEIKITVLQGLKDIDRYQG
jgi:hypothetical protein